jgi:hypothetical protein
MNKFGTKKVNAFAIEGLTGPACHVYFKTK